MNLISCEGCGVVLNKDHITFPPLHVDDDDYYTLHPTAEWSNRENEYITAIPCPACGSHIFGEPSDV